VGGSAGDGLDGDCCVERPGSTGAGRTCGAAYDERALGGSADSPGRIGFGYTGGAIVGRQ